jgi:hypothetical protein
MHSVQKDGEALAAGHSALVLADLPFLPAIKAPKRLFSMILFIPQ